MASACTFIDLILARPSIHSSFSTVDGVGSSLADTFRPTPPSTYLTHNTTLVVISRRWITTQKLTYKPSLSDSLKFVAAVQESRFLCKNRRSNICVLQHEKFSSTSRYC